MSTFLPSMTSLPSGVEFSPFHLLFCHDFCCCIQCLQYLAPSGDPEGCYFIYCVPTIFAVELLNKNIFLYEVFSGVVIEVSMTFTIVFNQKRTVTVSPQ